VWINTIVASAVFTLAAHALVQWNINRLDWLDALKVRE
jgi:putative ABC transport system permease protein